MLFRSSDILLAQPAEEEVAEAVLPVINKLCKHEKVAEAVAKVPTVTAIFGCIKAAQTESVFSLALDGITSFSVKPIYGIVYLGGIFVFISILIGIYVLYALISGTAEHGWASLMLSIWFVGGVVLLSIGAVGLYIGKIYKEVKRRPLYNVEEVLYDDQNK